MSIYQTALQPKANIIRSILENVENSPACKSTFRNTASLRQRLTLTLIKPKCPATLAKSWGHQPALLRPLEPGYFPRSRGKFRVPRRRVMMRGGLRESQPQEADPSDSYSAQALFSYLQDTQPSRTPDPGGTSGKLWSPSVDLPCPPTLTSCSTKNNLIWILITSWICYLSLRGPVQPKSASSVPKNLQSPAEGTSYI